MKKIKYICDMDKNNISQKITKKILSFPMGVPFGYEQIRDSLQESNNTSVALNSLQKKGTIRKLGRGVYYRPEISEYGFGELPVNENALIDYVSQKYNGYISGSFAYNMIGITTQTARIICIATPQPQKPLNLGQTEFVFKKSKFGYATGKKNLKALIFLDALTEPRNVPGNSVNETLTYLASEIKKFSEKDTDTLTNLCLSYPKRTRMRLYEILKNEKNKETILKTFTTRI